MPVHARPFRSAAARRIAAAPLLLAAALLLSGCQSSPDAAAGAMPRSDHQGPTNDRDIKKAAEFADALAGLDFDTGRLVVTQPARASRSAAAAAARDGDGFIQENRRTAAIRAYAIALRHAPENAELCRRLAWTLNADGKMDHAIAAYRTAVELDPARDRTRFESAMALSMAGRHPEALEEMLALLELNPDHADAHERLAIWFYYASDFDSARRHAAAATALGRPMPPQFLSLLNGQAPGP